MIDDPKGFASFLSDEDWAVLGAHEPKLQTFTELKKQGYATPIIETVKPKAVNLKNITPVLTSQKYNTKDKEKEPESEDEDQSDDDQAYGNESQDEDDEGQGPEYDSEQDEEEKSPEARKPQTNGLKQADATE